MFIDDLSRYAQSPIYRVPLADGSSSAAIYAEEALPVGFDFAPYMFEEGDRIDLLASRFYNDPEKWWLIMVANPEYMLADEIAPGTTLRIPYAV